MDFERRSAPSKLPDRALGLDRRARNRAVGTEHTTVAWLGPQRRAAAGTSIEKLAGVGWHCLRFRGGAMRTGNHGFKNHVLPQARLSNRRSRTAPLAQGS